MAAKKLRDFPPTLLEALIERLDEMYPPPVVMTPVLNDADRWELAIKQGQRSVVDELNGALRIAIGSPSKPAPLVEDAE